MARPGVGRPSRSLGGESGGGRLSLVIDREQSQRMLTYRLRYVHPADDPERWDLSEKCAEQDRNRDDERGCGGQVKVPAVALGHIAWT